MYWKHCSRHSSKTYPQRRPQFIISIKSFTTKVLKMRWNKLLLSLLSSVQLLLTESKTLFNVSVLSPCLQTQTKPHIMYDFLSLFYQHRTNLKCIAEVVERLTRSTVLAQCARLWVRLRPSACFQINYLRLALSHVKTCICKVQIGSPSELL